MVLARAATLRVTFNPKVVSSYRLMGHEAATITGEAGDPLVTDLLVEQTATSLYELWLKPGSTGVVAQVELKWRDPNSGQPRRHVQWIQRSQVAPSFADAEPWLQQGIVAARVAEYLRGSYYVPSTRRWEPLVELAQQVAPAARTPQFRSLERLIDDAARLRQRPSSSACRPPEFLPVSLPAPGAAAAVGASRVIRAEPVTTLVAGGQGTGKHPRGHTNRGRRKLSAMLAGDG